MALHFALRINGDTIGNYVATRREKEIPSGGACTYDVTIIGTVMDRGTALGEPMQRRGIVRHNYHDGAFELVRRSLELLCTDAQPQTRKTATCAVCGGTFHVNRDGTMRYHLGNVKVGRFRQMCDGYGKPPAQTAGEA